MNNPTPVPPVSAPSVYLKGPVREHFKVILTPAALSFVAELVREFRPRLTALMQQRVEQQAWLDAGNKPDFLPETAHIRDGDWTIAPVPAVLQDRRVEITGPVSRKMVINALNSGASMFMADFEDSSAPTWDNMIDGQVNLYDAIRGTISFFDERRQKSYQLGEQTATLLIRPRGLHLPESHLQVDGAPAPGCLLDFGLYFFHNAAALIAAGRGPFFYLPKLQSHHEAAWWNDVFVFSQSRLGIAQGSIKATVLLETLPAAFEMHEILHALREHSSGLNCGRWDYIFSLIKTLRSDPAAVLPDRSQIGMTQHCMASYTSLVIKTCHRRGAHAMGGMAAQIPIKSDPVANHAALEKVRRDKLREVTEGHDGTWVAHPGLIAIAREVFDAHMPTPNQIHVTRDDVAVTAQDLLTIPEGTRTIEGLRLNVRVGVQYIESWIRGSGCVPLYNLMEDAATAEISRSQIWQWMHHGISLQDDRESIQPTLTPALLERVMAEELHVISQEIGQDRFKAGRFDEASALFTQLCTAPKMPDFLTTSAYALL